MYNTSYTHGMHYQIMPATHTFSLIAHMEVSCAGYHMTFFSGECERWDLGIRLWRNIQAVLMLTYYKRPSMQHVLIICVYLKIPEILVTENVYNHYKHGN